jgi:hypothetical protein
MTFLKHCFSRFLVIPLLFWSFHCNLGFWPIDKTAECIHCFDTPHSTKSGKKVQGLRNLEKAFDRKKRSETLFQKKTICRRRSYKFETVLFSRNSSNAPLYFLQSLRGNSLLTGFLQCYTVAIAQVKRCTFEFHSIVILSYVLVSLAVR